MENLARRIVASIIDHTLENEQKLETLLDVLDRNYSDSDRQGRTRNRLDEMQQKGTPLISFSEIRMRIGRGQVAV